MTASGLDGTVPLAVVERGGTVESVHRGAVAVVDAHGALVASAGSPDLVAFTRSALKPLQALPFVAAGGPAHFGLTPVHVALMCASHSGEARHQVAVAELLQRIGCGVDELRCGTHAPYVYDALGEPPPPPPYSPLGHNCSGKHAGMLAHCVLRAWPRDGYLDPAHPLQQAIRAAVAGAAGLDADRLVMGIDGCSAPNYAMPLAALAGAFARLAAARDGPSGAIATAMAAHPEYVAGTRRGDLWLMQAGRGAWIAKAGAEGMQTIGLRDGLGVAIKVADGSPRAVLPVAIAVLEALGALDAPARADLAPRASPVLHNAAGVAVGRVRPVVVLDREAADAGRRGGRR